MAAVAFKVNGIEKLVNHNSRMKDAPNVTSVVEAGKPSTVGKKPQQKALRKVASKCVRKILVQAKEFHYSKRTSVSTSHISDFLQTCTEKEVSGTKKSTELPSSSTITLR